MISICSLCSKLQLAVGLVQQVFGSLRVAGQIPFIGLLSLNDFFEGLPAEALRGSQIGMAAAGYVPFGWLSDGDSAEDQQCAKKGCEELGSDHG